MTHVVLQGRRVLLVEDESLVAMLIEDMLLDLGAEVEVAMRLTEALRLARSERFDMAVLDVNLGEGQRTDTVADALLSRGIPFLFSTGYGERGLSNRHRGTPTLQKPYREADLVGAIDRLLAD